MMYILYELFISGLCLFCSFKIVKNKTMSYLIAFAGGIALGFALSMILSEITK